MAELRSHSLTSYSTLTSVKESEQGAEKEISDPKWTEKLRVSIHKVDLGVVEEIQKLFEEAKRDHGGKGVDILVSNAGYGKRIVDISFVFPFILLYFSVSVGRFYIPKLYFSFHYQGTNLVKSKER